jgi:hypothetical protein
VLPARSAQPIGVVRERLRQNLDGDVALQAGIAHSWLIVDSRLGIHWTDAP